jgi:uncharacterized protein (UPF0548 family)
MLRLTRPSTDDLEQVLEEQRGEQPTYAPVGGTIRDEFPAGYRVDRQSAVLGQGDETWAKAVGALKDWGPQRGSGLTVLADGSIAEGTNVVVVAPLPLGFALAACRVVAVVDEPDRWGFAYGTLPVHPEEGEEYFGVRRDEGVVSFEIVAFSKPRDPLARLGAPVARRVQVRATRRYLEAMQAAVR